jgi:ATP-binding cassette subfamily C protein CydC
VVEGLLGLAEIIVFGAGPRFRENVRTSQSELLAGQRRMAHIRGLSAAAMHVLCGAAVLAALFLGCGRVSAGRLDGAALALIALAVTASFEAVSVLPAAFQFLSRTRAAGRRLLDVVEAAPPVSFTAATQPIGEKLDIAFENVSFRYRPELPPALDQVNITVRQGQRLAVVGESGAGKSTLANLLVRFFDPQTGAIRIGGTDIRELSEQALRQAVVVLSQQSHLFSATVRENLLIGRPQASDSELRSTLATARLADFVDGLPEGLDTWIGEAGRLLSAGQARRLAVARAVVRDAPIWVLDEPTEGLDRRTESELIESLLEVTTGRSVLWITHRLMGMEGLDRVMVMEKGRVADQGTHTDLLARHPGYASWYARMR